MQELSLAFRDADAGSSASAFSQKCRVLLLSSLVTGLEMPRDLFEATMRGWARLNPQQGVARPLTPAPAGKARDKLSRYSCRTIVFTFFPVYNSHVKTRPTSCLSGGC